MFKTTRSRYFQFDDWWFQQTDGDFGGMHEWRPCHQTINGSATYCSSPKMAPTAADRGSALAAAGGSAGGSGSASNPPSVFPSGEVGFLEGNPPTVLYMGLISNTTVYAKQNGGLYDMAIDGVFAVPLTPDFYRDLFANATKPKPIGLGVSRMLMFEQEQVQQALLQLFVTHRSSLPDCS